LALEIKKSTRKVKLSRGYKTCEIFLLCKHQLEEKHKNGNKKQLPLETKDQKQIQKKT